MIRVLVDELIARHLLIYVFLLPLPAAAVPLWRSRDRAARWAAMGLILEALVCAWLIHGAIG